MLFFLVIKILNSNNNLNVKIDTFLKSIKIKKKYLDKLKNKILILNNNVDTTKTLSNSSLASHKSCYRIKYIISITFSKTNTLLHVMDFSGKLKLFYSAGFFSYKGKKKRVRFLVFKELFKILLSKGKFLKNQPVALHLKNTRKFKIVKLLKRKLFLVSVKIFTSYPHNGCRKKKLKRKKFKKITAI
jgi:ribosomal protein S11